MSQEGISIAQTVRTVRMFAPAGCTSFSIAGTEYQVPDAMTHFDVPENMCKELESHGFGYVPPADRVDPRDARIAELEEALKAATAVKTDPESRQGKEDESNPAEDDLPVRSRSK